MATFIQPPPPPPDVLDPEGAETARNAEIQRWAEDQTEQGVLKEEIRERVKVRLAEKREAQLRSEEHQAELIAAFEGRLVELDDIPDPEPLIDGFLTKDSLARTFGPPKSLKSFCVLDMAACVSLGIPWKGHTTHEVPVLYIVAEGARGMKKRRRAWNTWHERTMNVTFYPEPIQINEFRAMQELIAFCKHREIGYVIFDTQARCTVGVDENSNTEMGQIVRALDVLKQETGACVHVVHHSGAGATDRGRGATAFDGAVDTEFRIEREEEGDGVSVITRFQKDMIEAEPVDMIACSVEGSLVLTDGGSTLSPEVIEPIPDVPETHVHVLRSLKDDYSQEGATQSEIREELGMQNNGAGRSRVTKIMNRLSEDALVYKNKEKRYFLTKLGHRTLRAASIHEVVSPHAPRATLTLLSGYDEEDE